MLAFAALYCALPSEKYVPALFNEKFPKPTEGQLRSRAKKRHPAPKERGVFTTAETGKTLPFDTEETAYFAAAFLR